MSLITETNRQYYEGAKSIVATANQTIFNFSGFDTSLIWKTSNADNDDYELNNFKFYVSTDNGVSFEEVVYYTTLISPCITSVNNGIITLNSGATAGDIYLVQLKRLEGGKYGDNNAFGAVVEENYGSYAYIKLDELINNFIVAYVGDDKLIITAKRTDIVFHAKRGLQEFSYDTLKSIKSQELTIPPSLNVIIPQDYVNYVKISRIDGNGVKHIIYPGMLNGLPYTMPIQDTEGIPIQDTFDANITGTSIIEERWKESNPSENNGKKRVNDLNFSNGDSNTYNMLGQRYGMDTANANFNGTFIINEREGKISFSSELVGSLILLEYISDGLAYDLDTKVPKLAEEAMYAYILHSVISNKLNQPEYLVQRLKQEKFAKLRNAKLRLSNIKLDEFTKVLRGQYKWIKQ
jgi:hypothetical protein